MALWKDQYGREQGTTDSVKDKDADKTAASIASFESSRASATQAAQPQARTDSKESLIASGLTIEG